VGEWVVEQLLRVSAIVTTLGVGAHLEGTDTRVKRSTRG
jgi:hypothetical protein